MPLHCGCASFISAHTICHFMAWGMRSASVHCGAQEGGCGRTPLVVRVRVRACVCAGVQAEGVAVAGWSGRR